MKHTAHGYWLEEAGEVEPLPELVGERSADVVVIGGGYTGMWAAWQVKKLEPEAAGGAARGGRVRAGAQWAERGVLQLDVVLAAEHAAALGG